MNNDIEKNGCDFNVAREIPLPYGAQCSWWDSMDKIGTLPQLGGLPCCPHCKGVLMQVDSEAAWWQNVKVYAAKIDDPTYIDFIKWLRGKCYPSFAAARIAYHAEQEHAS